MAPIATIQLEPRSLPKFLTFLAKHRATNVIESLARRQTTVVAVPTTYGNLDSGPSPGTVAGIVLGSVAGFLLILWILITIFGGGGGYGNFGYTANDNVSSVVVRDTRRRSQNRKTRSARINQTVIRETRERSSAPPVVLVEETRRTSRGPQTVISEDDEVVVIEEGNPTPRERERERERRRRRDSGYRTVDPTAYGGGGRPLREVRRSRR